MSWCVVVYANAAKPSDENTCYNTTRIPSRSCLLPRPFLAPHPPFFFASTATWCLSMLDCTDSNATLDHMHTAMLTQSTPSTPGPDVFPHFGENTLESERERERVHKGRRTSTTRPHNLSPHQLATVAMHRNLRGYVNTLKGNGIFSSSFESQCQTPCTCVDVCAFFNSARRSCAHTKRSLFAALAQNI